MNDEQIELAVEELEKEAEVEPPPMYKVVMHNDDFTPMDFVVGILQVYFGHSEENAEQIMYDVHQKGKGVAGIYTKDIAETKARYAMNEAQAHDFPFLLTVEPN